MLQCRIHIENLPIFKVKNPLKSVGLGFCLLLGLTTGDRMVSFMVPALLSLAAVPVVYPLAKAISAIGGNLWNE